MSFQTRENLVTILESLSHDGNFAHANRLIGAKSSGLIWRFVALAKSAKDENDRSSIWYLEWREREGWFTDHIARARAEQCASLDGLVRSQVKHGIESVVFSPSDGRPMIALAPEYEHLSQAQFDELRDPLDLPLDPKLRYQWNDDGTAKYLTRTDQIPASLKQKAMSATVPGWRDSVSVETNNRVSVQVMLPAPWVPKTAPQVIDAEFKELPAPKSVAELQAERVELLKRQAAEHLANPNRVTRPTAPVEYQGSGRPTFNEPLEKIGDRPADKPMPAPAPRPYVAPAPVSLPQAPMAEPVPSYVRRHRDQPARQVRADGSLEPMSSSARTTTR